MVMVEDIGDLIEKINQDGIRAAEEKAHTIEAAAKQRADDILASAEREAGEMISAAKDRIRRDDQKEKALLAQAGRDLLLTLREEINAMLERLLVSDIRQAMTPEAVSGLLLDVVRNYSLDGTGSITISMNKSDMENLEKYFLHKLREETKQQVLLRPAEEISGGFIISFDSGKSCFDFTDKALADYIGTYLKPKLNQILQAAMKE
jgi:V/A-type H+/Na+-transporting ATPase subunit E